MHRNKKNNGYAIAATSLVAALFTFAIIAAASDMTTIIPAAKATPTTTTTSNATTTTSSSEIIELSSEPVLQERQITIGQTPINQTHVLLSETGKGTLTLPNTTESINYTSNVNLIVSMMGTAIGKVLLTTEDGTENATATFYGIARFNMEDGTGKGIGISLLHTNSAGRLAPLNGMILAGEVEFPPDGGTVTTLWEWQSGIPLPTADTTTTAMQAPAQMNTTMTMATNATTTTTTITTTGGDTNATGAPEEGAVEDEQRETSSILAPNPLFE